MLAQQREAFIAHLRECARCDRAFRIFALSAPVLQSDSEPAVIENSWKPREISQGRHLGEARTPAQPSERWRPMAATMAALAIAAAALLFVSFTNVPAYQSLVNSLSSDSQAGSVRGSDISLLSTNVNAAGFDVALPSDGVLGQATPAEEVTIPALWNSNPDENNLAD